jgi:hypothetical protein
MGGAIERAWDNAHRERNVIAFGMHREACAVSALEREAQRVARVIADLEPRREHVAHLAPGAKVVDGPRVRGLFELLDDRRVLVDWVTGGGELRDIAHHILEVPASCMSVRARSAISSPNADATP